MHRYILLILGSILSFQLFAAEYLQAELVFKDGNIKKGYAQIPERAKEKYILYKSRPDTAEILIESEELSSISFLTIEGRQTYHRLKRHDFPRENKITSPQWLKVIEPGYVTLYYTTCFKGTVPYKVWLCYKEGDDAAHIILYVTSGTVLTLNPNSEFKKNARKYFVDFPNLEKSIDTKKYSWENIDLLVRDYNEWKNKKVK